LSATSNRCVSKAESGAWVLTRLAIGKSSKGPREQRNLAMADAITRKPANAMAVSALPDFECRADLPDGVWQIGKTLDTVWRIQNSADSVCGI
jgi:hypothetical protein